MMFSNKLSCYIWNQYKQVQFGSHHRTRLIRAVFCEAHLWTCMTILFLKWTWKPQWLWSFEKFMVETDPIQLWDCCMRLCAQFIKGGRDRGHAIHMHARYGSVSLSHTWPHIWLDSESGNSKLKYKAVLFVKTVMEAQLRAKWWQCLSLVCIIKIPHLSSLYGQVPQVGRSQSIGLHAHPGTGNNFFE